MATKAPLLRLVAALAVMTCGGLPLRRVGAQSVGTTDPVGVVTIALAAQSDTRVSIPFVRPARYAGNVQSVSGNVLTVADTPNWSANQFAFAPASGQHDTFFVLLGANPAAGTNPTPKEGCFYTVTANGANTLTVNLNGDDVSSVQPGTRMTLIPYWTLGTAFPATDVNRSFVASASLSSLATTIVPVPAQSSFGNGGLTPLSGPRNPRSPPPPPPPAHYFYAGAWRHTQQAATVVCDDDILLPDAHFIVRNTATTALSFRPPGVVLAGKISVPVPTMEGEDTYYNLPMGLPRPVAMTLNASGLAASGAVTDSSGDTVTVFDPAATGYNQAPGATYFLSGGAWRQSGAPATQDFGSVPVLTPGGGLILHKASGDGTTVFWLNAPNYPVGNP